jgi:hypothetical protein
MPIPPSSLPCSRMEYPECCNFQYIRSMQQIPLSCGLCCSRPEQSHSKIDGLLCCTLLQSMSPSKNGRTGHFIRLGVVGVEYMVILSSAFALKRLQEVDCRRVDNTTPWLAFPNAFYSWRRPQLPAYKPSA